MSEKNKNTNLKGYMFIAALQLLRYGGNLGVYQQMNGERSVYQQMSIYTQRNTTQPLKKKFCHLQQH